MNATIAARASVTVILAAIPAVSMAMNSAPSGSTPSMDAPEFDAAVGQPTQAQLTTDPPLLFASAKAGDTAYLLAVSLINEHRYQDAIDALQRARTTFGAHPDVLTYLGFANRKLGRYDVAISYYRQALAAAPNHKGATEYYGELLVERGDMVGAKRMLTKLDNSCTF